MTTVNNSKKFFVFGLLNGAGETFSGKKEYLSVIDGGKKAKIFYEDLGFKDIKMATCHGIVLVKDSNDRLLSFVAPISYISKKTCAEKEYSTVYWAWCEVKRQAEIVAKKAAKKIEALTKGKSAKFKGFNGLEQAKTWMRENNAPSCTFEHYINIRQIK